MERGERGDERRRHRRVEARIYAVKFRVLTVPPPLEPEPYRMGEVINLSKGGMCFVTRYPVAAGQRMQYFVDSPSGQSGREGIARVVRIHGESDGIFVAVEFIT
ncbi:MAG TPA: PilZ domain-containing protein [Planctomycetota bacterium]|nr:PilZ domain-containing protein [Planctomycetota bacterium]